ncbi:hypothetical protein DXG03_005675 [Asterophora parasitica]|uniref:Erg28-like protein n=1 Tax=Asterophora parasitica TaxID=117018 RepID=A0A9P7G5R0_9AGAR|nr:hypothetical protein DXG03_005675 [Asterophora parasitica]
MLGSLQTYLPQTEGYLAYWQLIVAAAAFFNSAQNFTTLSLTRRIYNVKPANVTALQARTFAIWTLTSGIVRAYAAYNIHNKTIYDIAMFTYLIAFGHFSSEWFIFRTASFNAALLSPVVVSTASLVWMFTQYSFYVKA